MNIKVEIEFETVQEMNEFFSGKTVQKLPEKETVKETKKTKTSKEDDSFVSEADADKLREGLSLVVEKHDGQTGKDLLKPYARRVQEVKKKDLKALVKDIKEALNG